MDMEIRHRVSAAWETGKSAVEYCMIERCP